MSKFIKRECAKVKILVSYESRIMYTKIIYIYLILRRFLKKAKVINFYFYSRSIVLINSIDKYVKNLMFIDNKFYQAGCKL